jgi:glycosyltransferase involved in cell wall biosynthesis
MTAASKFGVFTSPSLILVMRLRYFHQYFCTPNGSGGVRSYEFARRWVGAGHHVTIVTGSGYDETLIAGKSTDIDGIDVRVIDIAYRPTLGVLGRLIRFFLFAIRASVFALRSRRYDIVLATSTPLSIAMPALIAKIICKRKVVFEVRDVWPDAAVDAGVLRDKGVLFFAARFLELFTYRQVDKVVALSDGMVERIAKKGVPRTKLAMIPNCCDISRFSPGNFSRMALRREFGLFNDFVLLYVGAISRANDMQFLIRCIKALQSCSGVTWWFVGGGNMLSYMDGELSRHGFVNVKLWGMQPKYVVPRLVACADAGIVSFINKPVYYENSPNKFFDYIAGGLPAIFTRTTWLSPYLKRYNAELVCTENTVEEFVDLVKKLKDDSTLRAEIGNNVYDLACHSFSRDVLSARYLSLLKELLGSACETNV